MPGQHLRLGEFDVGVEDAQPLDAHRIGAGGTALHPVDDRRAHHLESAADAQRRFPLGRAADQGVVELPFAQPPEIMDRGLRAGQHHQVGPCHGAGVDGPFHAHARLRGQRLDVRGVGHPRQPDRRDGEHIGAQRRARRADRRRGDGAQRIFRIDPQAPEEREDAEDRHPRALRDHVEARHQQLDGAAELVDHESRDPVAVGLAEDRVRAHEMRQHPAAVDVADDQDRQVGRFRQPHVGDVRLPQIDFRRGPGALADHDVEPRAQILQAGGGHRPQCFATLPVRRRRHTALGAAADDDLAGLIRAGLEQHRIEIDAGLQPAGQRLQRLGAADFTAVGGHGAVVGHVLRLERRHRHPAPRQQPAHPRDQHGLAGIRRAPRDEERAARLIPPPPRHGIRRPGSNR